MVCAKKTFYPRKTHAVLDGVHLVYTLMTAVHTEVNKIPLQHFDQKNQLYRFHYNIDEAEMMNSPMPSRGAETVHHDQIHLFRLIQGWEIPPLVDQEVGNPATLGEAKVILTVNLCCYYYCIYYYYIYF
jgi:hypothetical protein